jgi:2-polyprenyl-3-methyl-5-hydroxy-6-metoxy-1,4-benzoquinol methylase
LDHYAYECASCGTSCRLCDSPLSDAPIVGETSRHGHSARRVACIGCGLVQRSPQPDPAEMLAYYRTKYRSEYTALPVIYDGQPVMPSDARYEAILRAGAADYASLVANHSSGRDVLELGAGEGYLTAALVQRGYRVTAIDPDEACAKRLRELDARVVCGSWETARETATGPFDAIVSQHSLEHMPDPLGVLRDCRKRLRSTGALIVEVPNVMQPYGDLGRWYWQHVHLYDFSADTLTRLLAAAGFRVREMRAEHHALLTIAEPARGEVRVTTEQQNGHWIAGYLARYSAEGEQHE